MIKDSSKENSVYTGRNSTIIRGNSNGFDCPVCYKLANEEFPASDISWYFENEYEYSSNTKCPSVRKALGQTTIDDHNGIILEYIEGDDLKTYLEKNKPSIHDKLAIAAEIALALSELHKENIIHNNINPGNILIRKGTSKVLLIDLQIALKNSLKLENTNNYILGKANLSYIAPEQTGRINRPIDHRTDLYSLGVVLYEMFTGRLPFTSSDPVELIYAHLAKTPVSPGNLSPGIPPVVSAIIDRLLAKNAEDRYQSAFGVCYDLKYLGQSTPKDGRFTLGMNDFSGKLLIHSRLYAKEQERKSLLATFSEVAAGGAGLVFICGYSGSGKTTLANELQKPVFERKGFFINGKFNQFQHDTPYAAFILAFRELVDYILTKDEEFLAGWKKTILDSVGSLGKVLIDLIPGIEAVIGPQPEVPFLRGQELQSRFNYVLGNFIKAIACEKNPLVIFIDDLHWADASSLNLFDLILSDKAAKYIMLIGAYRENEITAGHVVQKLLDELSDKKVTYTKIQVHDLQPADVKNIVTEVLGVKQENADELSRLIYTKTKGNPFYMHRFLQSIYDEGSLYFDFDKKEWCWNSEEIVQMNVSGNVADLVRSTIEKLSPRAVEVLKVAACLGMSFDLDDLSVATGIKENALQSILQQAMVEGLIIYATSHYKFAHDRIQHTIYSLLSDADRKEYHLKIARAFSAGKDDEISDNIFDLVSHWNAGADILRDRKEINYAAHLNLLAGRKARASAAYQQAYPYFDRALHLLSDESWNSDYRFVLQLHNEAAEAAFLAGEMDKVEQMVNKVLEKAAEWKDTLSAREVNIQKLIAGNKQNEAIALGIGILKKFGIKFPANPGTLATVVGVMRIKMLLGKKPSAFYENLPVITDPDKLVVYRILSELLSAGYWAAPNLVPLLIFKMVELSVKQGLSPKSPFAFAALGYILSVYMGQTEQGIHFGEIALNVSRKLKTEEVTPRLLMTKNIFLVHWTTRLSELNDELEQGFRSGLETGDNEYTTYLAQNIIYNSFYAGAPLHRLADKAEVLDQQVEKFRQDLTIIRIRIFRESIANLINDSPHPDVLSGYVFDENKVNIPDSLQNRSYYQNLNLQKTFLAVTFNRDKEAYDYATTCEKYQESIKGSALDLVFYFYQSLALAAIYDTAEPRVKKLALKKLKANLKRLKKYEGLCKDNFMQKRLLAEAELYKVQGNFGKAKNLYDYAIKAAVENHMVQDEAICWERSAQYYRSQKHDQVALFYYKNALNAYQRWGADAKVRQLSSVIEEYKKKSGLMAGESHTAETAGLMVDMATIVKASTALSGEIVLSNLLKKLMQIMLENAGAQQGYLILEKNGEKVIEAEIVEETDEVKTMQSMPLAECAFIAKSVVNYVASKREPVLLDNAADSTLFGDDEFIRKRQSRSILCAPLLNKGKLQGIIYLSNDVTFGAFTKQRLEFITLLSGQIAVSIENALFYDELEQRVEKRTYELQQEKKKTDDLLLNILPKDVAEELKNTGRSKARRYDKVTVMFTDFRNFTQHSVELSPEELVGEVDFCFRNFDKIITKHGLEKIKTIGDAYLCVGGIPDDDGSVERVINAAIEMRDFMDQIKEARIKEGQTFFEMRIGITTGPIIAGIVGEKKFAYDIWGDTVNTAARMEQSGEVGKINISGITYGLIKSKFDCLYRGKITAKNKGEIDMYFVERAKEL